MNRFLPFPGAVPLLATLLTLPLLPAAAQTGATALYVNDSGTAGDRFTTAPGNDATGNGTPAAPYATVQRALAQAGTGTTTIFVDAGTYTERVVWNKNISLRGAGTLAADSTTSTIFDGGLAPSSTQTSETGIFLAATGGTAAAPLTLANLTVKAYDFGVQTDNGTSRAYVLLEDVETIRNRRCGIYWNSLGGPADNITFRRVRATHTAIGENTNLNGAGRGLFLVNGSKLNILIEEGYFALNRRAGIDVNDGSVSGLIIRNNRFTLNGGAAIALLGAGGQRVGGTYTTPAALIEGNRIVNNASNGLELKACTGNGRPSGPGSFVVRNNFIARTVGSQTNINEDNAGIAFVDRDRNTTGIVGGVNGDLVTGGAVIQNNIIRGYLADAQRTMFQINGFGIVVEGGNNKVLGNVVAQCQRGVQVQDRPTASSGSTPFFDIANNIGLISTGDSIRNNRLDSCATAIRTVNLTTPVEASLNWLGSTDATAVQGAAGKNGLVATLRGPAGSFAEVPVADATSRLDYSPFLHSRLDVASDLPGFQPDLTYLHVDAASRQTSPVGYMQEGLALVTENGTLSTIAGAYDEDAIFSKSLTLTNTGATLLRAATLNGAGVVVTLDAPLTLTGNLTLTNGLLRTSAANLLTLSNGATATAGNATAYVAGPLRKLGNQAFVFPLGQDATWARLGISAPADSAAGFTAEYIATAYNPATATAPLNNVSRVEYWTLEPTGPASPVAVQLYWENAFRSGIDAFTNDLQVAQFDSTAWVTNGNGGLSGSLNAGAVASASPVAAFGAFTFGSLSPTVNPLTRELLNFVASQPQPRVVDLVWEVESANQGQDFDVERSFDGTGWARIGTVTVGNRRATGQLITYTYQDQPGTTATLVYYRLRQLTPTGEARYSQPLAVTLPSITLAVGAKASAQLALFPNPATTQTTLRLPQAATGLVHAELLDLTGRVVLIQDLLPTPAADYQLNLPPALPAGVYLVRVHGAKLPRQMVRLVKQN